MTKYSLFNVLITEHLFDFPFEIIINPGLKILKTSGTDENKLEIPSYRIT